MNNVFEMYMEHNFANIEGERGVRNLENLCEVLGYGKDFMRGRAIEEFLSDNPGAVEAVVCFIQEWTECNSDWEESIRDSLEQDGLLEEDEEDEYAE